MILRLGIACVCLFVAACSDRGTDTTESDTFGKSDQAELDRQISLRINDCIEKGATELNCECRANTTAQHLSLEDFAEETRLLLSNDGMGLDEFQRRMFADHRDTMFALGEALAACPLMRIQLE
ncbi:MAG: hypothetical protein AAF996_14295 [Pseudomonadota bacterium]